MRYIIAGSIAFALVAGIALGSVVSRGLDSEAEARGKNGAIAGRVGAVVTFTPPTFTPFEGVTVALPGTDLITTTDAEGRFMLDEVPAGVWTVVTSQVRDSGALCFSLIPNVQVTDRQVTEIPGFTIRPALCQHFPSGVEAP